MHRIFYNLNYKGYSIFNQYGTIFYTCTAGFGTVYSGRYSHIITWFQVYKYNNYFSLNIYIQSTLYTHCSSLDMLSNYRYHTTFSQTVAAMATNPKYLHIRLFIMNYVT